MIQKSNVIGTKQHLTFRGNAVQGRHGWLRLTPAYSLSVVESILLRSNADSNDYVLDPFCGTGTTPLTASMNGIPAHAVDINPFLTWFANTKFSIFTSREAQQLTKKGISIASSIENASVKETFWVPDLFQIDKWWDENTLKILSYLYYTIQDVSSSPIKDLLKIAFCRTMIKFAHVSFGHQSMSFKNRGTSLFDSLNDNQERIAAEFLASVQTIAEGMLVQNPLVEAKVFLGDSRTLTKSLPLKKYSLVITSPPYPNRMSYIRELRPYMYWTGFLADGRAAGELDWQAIGGTWGCATSMLNTWSPPEKIMPNLPDFYRTIEEIAEIQPILSRYIHKYFCDMKMHIRELKKVLRKGAKCYYIVGNSKSYDTLVAVEQYFAHLFEEEGFVDVEIDVLRKRSSKKELFEYVVSAKRR